MLQEEFKKQMSRSFVVIFKKSMLLFKEDKITFILIFYHLILHVVVEIEELKKRFYRFTGKFS